LDKISSQVHIVKVTVSVVFSDWEQINLRGTPGSGLLCLTTEIEGQSPQKKIELGNFSRTVFSLEFLDVQRWGR